MVRYPFDTLTVLSLSALLKTLRISKGKAEGLTTNGGTGTYSRYKPFTPRYRTVKWAFFERIKRHA